MSLNLLLDKRQLHNGKIMIDVYNISSLKVSHYLRSGAQQRAPASRLPLSVTVTQVTWMNLKTKLDRTIFLLLCVQAALGPDVL